MDQILLFSSLFTVCLFVKLTYEWAEVECSQRGLSRLPHDFAQK